MRGCWVSVRAHAQTSLHGQSLFSSVTEVELLQLSDCSEVALQKPQVVLGTHKHTSQHQHGQQQPSTLPLAPVVPVHPKPAVYLHQAPGREADPQGL